MSTFGEEQERVRPVHELAEKINAGRKPVFGDLLRNLWASSDNPQRDGRFVRVVSTTGRINPGPWYEITDGKGKFWQCGAKACVFVEHLIGDEVYPW